MIKMLLVDDEAYARRAIKSFLNFEQLGIELVGEAENGSSAMTAIQSKNKPQIIITDMNMPIMDGVSLLQYLCDCQPDIKIIVVSGFFDFQYTKMAICAKVQDYLLKPIDGGELNRAVQKCILELKKQKQESDDKVQILKNAHNAIDVTSYKRFLAYKNNMKPILTNGDFSNARELLMKVRDYLVSSPDSYEESKVVLNMFTDILIDFLLEQQYPLIDIQTLKIINKRSAVQQIIEHLETLYLRAFKHIHNIKLKSNGADTLEMVKIYIQNNYRAQLKLSEIADQHYISKEYLSAAFHSRYGITASDFIMQLKIEDSILQLKYSNLPINGIAEALGYDDVPYFNRVFKKYTHYSPSHFRKLVTEENFNYEAPGKCNI